MRRSTPRGEPEHITNVTTSATGQEFVPGTLPIY